MASIKRKAPGVYTLRWRDPDGSQRQFTSKGGAEAAKEHFRRIEAHESLGKRYDPLRGRIAPTLRTVVVAYLRARSVRLAPGTIRQRATMLSDLERFASKHLRKPQPRISHLSRRLLEEWQHHMLTRKAVRNPETKRLTHGRCSPAIAGQRVTQAYSFWAWAYDHDEYGEWTPRPRKVEVAPLIAVSRRAATWEEVDRFIETAADSKVPHWAHLLMVLRCTGLRVSQAVQLRWDDVDMDKQMLHVRPELGKSKQERRGRFVPLAPVLVDEIATWGRREGFLIHIPAKCRRPHHGTMKKLAKRSGGPEHLIRQPCHAVRRAFVSGLAAAGVRDEVRAFLVGHSRGIQAIYTSDFALLDEARAAVESVPLCASGARVVEADFRNTGGT